MRIRILKSIFHFLLFFYISISIFCIFTNKTYAQKASLYLAPSTGTYTVGNTFLVQVKVNSGGVAINAADGTIVFDPDKLEVVKISKENSIFTLWVQEPTFSNSLGTINFAGGKPSPGFIGAAGTIATITFRAKTAGTAHLTFASGSVLADDGKGTNILSNTGSGVYQLVAKEIVPLPPSEGASLPSRKLPPAPLVTSPTHPEENQWYSNNSPKFEWKLPQDVIQISYIIDKNPTTDSKKIFNPTSSVVFSNLEDGIWYFHISFKNQYGWGPTTHRKVMIDTTPPLPFEIEIKIKEPTDPQPVLFFETTDELSGIEEYELVIDQGESLKAKSPTKLLPQAPGTHFVVVKAFDKARNFTEAKKEFKILPIETPEIKTCPRRISPCASLTLEGKSIKNGKVRVFLQREGEEPILKEIKANEEGKWIFVSDPLKEGKYRIWVEAMDERGALSLASEVCEFYVELPSFLRFGKIAVDYLSIMATLIVLIIGLIVIIFYTWYRISLWRRKLRTETKELAQAILAAFKALREEVQDQIEYLDGRPGLTNSEAKVRDKLKEALELSEKFIGKELKDIEKELE